MHVLPHLGASVIILVYIFHNVEGQDEKCCCLREWTSSQQYQRSVSGMDVRQIHLSYKERVCIQFPSMDDEPAQEGTVSFKVVFDPQYGNHYVTLHGWSFRLLEEDDQYDETTGEHHCDKWGGGVLFELDDERGKCLRSTAQWMEQPISWTHSGGDKKDSWSPSLANAWTGFQFMYGIGCDHDLGLHHSFEKCKGRDTKRSCERESINSTRADLQKKKKETRQPVCKWSSTQEVCGVPHALRVRDDFYHKQLCNCLHCK